MDERTQTLQGHQYSTPSSQVQKSHGVAHPRHTIVDECIANSSQNCGATLRELPQDLRHRILYLGSPLFVQHMYLLLQPVHREVRPLSDRTAQDFVVDIGYRVTSGTSTEMNAAKRSAGSRGSLINGSQVPETHIKCLLMHCCRWPFAGAVVCNARSV